VSANYSSIYLKHKSLDSTKASRKILEKQMSADLIEYMVESCVEKGKTSLRYMEKIAIDWYEKGIDTIEKAKK